MKCDTVFSREQLDHQAKEKERHVRDLEEKILLLKQEHQDEKNMWQKKVSRVTVNSQ